MTDKTPDDVIEQAAKVLHDMNGCDDPYGTCISISKYYRGEARALHAAGLLADPADRDELEAWRSGRRRKAWPTIESVPDGLHYAAELARAQGTEGGEAHDELLRQAATRLKNLNDHARMLLAEKERVEAEVAELREKWLADAWDEGWLSGWLSGYRANSYDDGTNPWRKDRP